MTRLKLEFVFIRIEREQDLPGHSLGDKAALTVFMISHAYSRIVGHFPPRR